VNRRDTVLALMALGAAPAASFAQQPAKLWRIGFLVPRGRPASIDADTLGAFVRGMRELGYEEGRNLVVEWRFAENLPERLPPLARELAASKPDVIVTVASPATLAMKSATASIPIVMTGVADPLATGLMKNLARPEANVTGLSNLTNEVGPKQVQVLLEIVPKVSRIATLFNATNPTQIVIVRGVQDSARQAGKTVIPMSASNPQEIAEAFAGMAKERADAVIVAGDPTLNQHRRRIIELAMKQRLPCMGPFVVWVEEGSLASFGAGGPEENFARAAYFVDRILKGAKPGDLPVEFPTTFQLAVNRRTAKALGITIPQSVLIRADKVIE
jgi:putative ABC transport system substrate-binding protein